MIEKRKKRYGEKGEEVDIKRRKDDRFSLKEIKMCNRYPLSYFFYWYSL